MQVGLNLKRHWQNPVPGLEPRKPKAHTVACSCIAAFFVQGSLSPVLWRIGRGSFGWPVSFGPVVPTPFSPSPFEIGTSW